MSGTATGRGQAYIIFDYNEALHIYDSVAQRSADVDQHHCAICEAQAERYHRILLQLVEFFNAVDVSSDYVQSRLRAREAHDASPSFREPADGSSPAADGSR